MIYLQDALTKLKEMPAGSIQCCVTSPPYWGLRDYGIDGQLGLEKTPEEYTAKLVGIFHELQRALADDGTLWLNLGDSYASGKGTCYNLGGGTDSLGQYRKEMGAHPLDRGNKSTLAESGLKPKDLVGIPWRVAFALQADGWYLRSDIIWAKPNPMPESVTDRPTRSHEYIFLLTKSARYYYNAEAIKEPVADGTLLRIGQPNLENQKGSRRANGGTRADRPFKPVLFGGTHAEDYGTTRHSGKEWNPQEASWKGSKFDNPRDIDRHPDVGRNREKKDFDSSHGGGGTGFNGHKGNVLADGTTYLLRNKRDVWTVTTKPFKEAHFATFPPDLIAPCILAGSKIGDLVWDPFMGAGTTAIVALKYGRKYGGTEINPEYVKLAERRIRAFEKGQIKLAL